MQFPLIHPVNQDSDGVALAVADTLPVKWPIDRPHLKT